MIRIMLQKLLHKKWMVISLLIGNILLIAVAVSHPMYKEASLQRMLTDEFTTYLEDTNESPAMFAITGRIRKNDGTADYQRVYNLAQTIYQELGLTETLRVRQDSLVASTVVSLMERENANKEKKAVIGSLENLEEHATVVTGRMYSDKRAEDGVIEAVVTMNGFVELDVLPDETLEFVYLKDAAGNKIRVKIVGVITNSSSADDYWVNPPETFDNQLLISPTLFEEVFVNGGKRFEYNSEWYLFFDYSKITTAQIAGLQEKTLALLEGNSSTYGKLAEPAYLSLLNEYLSKEKKIDVTLSILQVPVLVLLCAFLFMISRQMMEMEQSEISLLKSRGAGKGQIFRLYLMQSTFLAVISTLIGIPLGSFICRALGSANAFLEFVQRRPLDITYSKNVFLYALIAVLVSILMTVLPAMKQSGISIVRQKQSRARAKKPLWQKLYLDIVLLGVSIYGYYNFTDQQDELQEAVIAGEALDPLLFLTSSLFILGASLVALRILPLLVKLVYQIGKKRWKPAGYASFLEIIRTGSRQYFIMAFLMLTVALGIFNTTVARTILENAEQNLAYTTGADLRIQEVWPSNELQVRMNPGTPLVYTEPDYGKYSLIEDVNAMAKVFVSDSTKTGISMRQKNADGKTANYWYGATIYGIDTKDFGEATSLPDGLLEEHYYTYLNALAQNPNGVLVSSVMRDVHGYKIGDTITFDNSEHAQKDGVDIKAEIVGFVEYFPGFSPTATFLNPDGTAQTLNQYLIISSLNLIQKYWGVTPYQIWFDVEDTTAFYEFIAENEIELEMCVDVEAEVIKIKNDTIFQGTSGILTMSFIVILILCSAGYLIYWVLSIRSRELLFGIFRAMGMSRGEILRMLVNEQIFSSLLSILCGAGIGVAASQLFVPMIQLAYSAADQVLPMTLLTRQSDMVRLFGIIAVVLVVCLFVLARQVFKMKIAQALKLGED
ncbi:MAG: ABC transporter permease [Lachnospiraceae bacterium]|nr:ABC transporter permease [Lachnospiraceae bacterium]